MNLTAFLDNRIIIKHYDNKLLQFYSWPKSKSMVKYRIGDSLVFLMRYLFGKIYGF